MELHVPAQVGVGVKVLTKMTVTEAIHEVYGTMDPHPDSDTLQVSNWYRALGKDTLETRDDFVSFAHVVLAAAFAPPTGMGRQMIVGTSIGVFCVRRGIRVRGIEP